MLYGPEFCVSFGRESGNRFDQPVGARRAMSYAAVATTLRKYFSTGKVDALSSAV